MIRFQCPQCRGVLEAPDRKGGEKINCPACGQRLQIPRPPSVPARKKTVLGALLSPIPSPRPRPASQPATAKPVPMRCPACSTVVQVPRSLAGQVARCPSCDATFRVKVEAQLVRADSGVERDVSATDDYTTASRWQRIPAGTKFGMMAVVVLLGLIVVIFAMYLWKRVESPALPPDLAKIPKDAVFLASARTADLWNSDLNKSVRRKFDGKFGMPIDRDVRREFERKFGMPIGQVERFTVAVLKANGPAEPLFFVGTVKAYDRDEVIAAGEKGKEERYKGQTFYTKGDDWAVYPLGERALVYGKASNIRGLIDHPAKGDGNLADALRLAAGKHSMVFAADVQAINDEHGGRLSGKMEDFKALLHAMYCTLTMDVDTELRADVKLVFANEKEAEAAIRPARTGLRLALKGLQKGVDELSEQRGRRQIAGLLQQFEEGLAATQIEQEGNSLQASVQLKVDVANGEALLAEAAQNVREAADRAQSQNKLKQMALAMLNHASMYGGYLPRMDTVFVRRQVLKKPLLSWRVAILPFIEQQHLYKQFKLDEPWDSPNNIKLLGQMPAIYKLPGDDKTPPDHTHYQVFVGNRIAFSKYGPAKIPLDFSDGTSNTILIVEAARAVPWTKPEDIDFDPNKPIKPLLGGHFLRGFNVALADGSVRFVTSRVSESTLKAAITCSGGDVLGPDW